MPSVVMLRFVKLSGIILSAVMLSVFFMLSVVKIILPLQWHLIVPNGTLRLILTLSIMEQNTFKNVNNCLNTNIYSYLEVKVLIYVEMLIFLTPVLIRHLWQLKTVVFPALVSNTFYCLKN
jgi:hypothetical protein